MIHTMTMKDGFYSHGADRFVIENGSAYKRVEQTGEHARKRFHFAPIILNPTLTYPIKPSSLAEHWCTFHTTDHPRKNKPSRHHSRS